MAHSNTGVATTVAAFGAIAALIGAFVLVFLVDRHAAPLAPSSTSPAAAAAASSSTSSPLGANGQVSPDAIRLGVLPMLAPGALDACANAGDGLVEPGATELPALNASARAAHMRDGRVIGMVFGQWQDAMGGAVLARLYDRQGNVLAAVAAKCLDPTQTRVDRFVSPPIVIGGDPANGMAIQYVRAADPIERTPREDGIAWLRPNQAPVYVPGLAPGDRLVAAVVTSTPAMPSGMYTFFARIGNTSTTRVFHPLLPTIVLPYRVVAATRGSTLQVVAAVCNGAGLSLAISTAPGRWPPTLAQTRPWLADRVVDADAPVFIEATLSDGHTFAMAYRDLSRMPRSVLVSARSCLAADVVPGCVPADPLQVSDTCTPRQDVLSTACVRLHAPLPMATLAATRDGGLSTANVTVADCGLAASTPLGMRMAAGRAWLLYETDDDGESLIKGRMALPRGFEAITTSAAPTVVMLSNATLYDITSLLTPS